MPPRGQAAKGQPARNQPAAQAGIQWNDMKTQQTIRNLAPVLEHYNYNETDIFNLVKRCNVDKQEIQLAVANIIEDRAGHEQEAWGKMPTKKEQKELKQKEKERREQEQKEKEEHDLQIMKKAAEDKKRRENAEAESRRRNAVAAKAKSKTAVGIKEGSKAREWGNHDNGDNLEHAPQEDEGDHDDCVEETKAEPQEDAGAEEWKQDGEENEEDWDQTNEGQEWDEGNPEHEDQWSGWGNQEYQETQAETNGPPSDPAEAPADAWSGWDQVSKSDPPVAQLKSKATPPRPPSGQEGPPASQEQGWPSPPNAAVPRSNAPIPSPASALTPTPPPKPSQEPSKQDKLLQDSPSVVMPGSYNKLMGNSGNSLPNVMFGTLDLDDVPPPRHDPPPQPTSPQKTWGKKLQNAPTNPKAWAKVSQPAQTSASSTAAGSPPAVVSGGKGSQNHEQQHQHHQQHAGLMHPPPASAPQGAVPPPGLSDGNFGAQPYPHYPPPGGYQQYPPPGGYQQQYPAQRYPAQAYPMVSGYAGYSGKGTGAPNDSAWGPAAQTTYGGRGWGKGQ